MPPLPNARHERFAQELAKGKPVGEAQATSGFALKTCDSLVGFYVYALVDSRDDTIFYIGKGKGLRFGRHVKEWKSGKVGNPSKHQRIADIYAAGAEVKHFCIEDALSEADAMDLECGFIQTVGRKVLTNWLQGVPSESLRLASQIREDRKRLRTFCESMERVWPVWFRRSDKSIDRAAYEAHYWGIQGSLSSILAKVEDRAHA